MPSIAVTPRLWWPTPSSTTSSTISVSQTRSWGVRPWSTTCTRSFTSGPALNPSHRHTTFGSRGMGVAVNGSQRPGQLQRDTCAQHARETGVLHGYGRVHQLHSGACSGEGRAKGGVEDGDMVGCILGVQVMDSAQQHGEGQVRPTRAAQPPLLGGISPPVSFAASVDLRAKR